MIAKSGWCALLAATLPPTSWLPRGGSEEGESPAGTARRELGEELGVGAENLGDLRRNPAGVGGRQVCPHG